MFVLRKKVVLYIFLDVVFYYFRYVSAHMSIIRACSNCTNHLTAAHTSNYRSMYVLYRSFTRRNMYLLRLELEIIKSGLQANYDCASFNEANRLMRCYLRQRQFIRRRKLRQRVLQRSTRLLQKACIYMYSCTCVAYIRY
jgi:hypothetical protein